MVTIKDQSQKFELVSKLIRFKRKIVENEEFLYLRQHEEFSMKNLKKELKRTEKRMYEIEGLLYVNNWKEDAIEYTSGKL